MVARVPYADFQRGNAALWWGSESDVSASTGVFCAVSPSGYFCRGVPQKYRLGDCAVRRRRRSGDDGGSRTIPFGQRQ
jgi:hypothetical protein